MIVRSSNPFEKTAPFYWVFVAFAAVLYLLMPFPGIGGTLFALVLLAMMVAAIRSVGGGAGVREQEAHDVSSGGTTEVVTLGSSIRRRLGGRRPVRTPRTPKSFQRIFMTFYAMESVLFALLVVILVLTHGKGYISLAFVNVVPSDDSYTLSLALACVAHAFLMWGTFCFLVRGARYAKNAQENDQQHG